MNHTTKSISYKFEYHGAHVNSNKSPLQCNLVKLAIVYACNVPCTKNGGIIMYNELHIMYVLLNIHIHTTLEWYYKNEQVSCIIIFQVLHIIQQNWWAQTLLYVYYASYMSYTLLKCSTLISTMCTSTRTVESWDRVC
jgi:hypothetical protein